MSHLKPQQKLPAKFVVDQQYHRVFTFRERWMIFIGYNLRTDFATRIDRRTGEVATKVQTKLTKHATNEDQQRADALDEAAKAGG